MCICSFFITHILLQVWKTEELTEPGDGSSKQSNKLSAVSMPHQFPIDLELLIFHLTFIFTNSSQVTQLLFYIGSVCQAVTKAECTSIRSGQQRQSKHCYSFRKFSLFSEPSYNPIDIMCTLT